MRKTRRNALADLVNIQTAPGNWNYDPYMHGMANGLILALAIIDGVEPKFLDAPKEWLCDSEKTHDQPWNGADGI